MKKNLAVMFAAAAMLAACGGDDGPDLNSPAPAPTPAPAPAPTPAPAPAPAVVPTSAASTIDTWFDYVLALIGSSSETAQPLAFADGFTPPTSDTAEPRSVP